MQYFLVFILAIGGGVFGGMVATQHDFGATTARTTVTNPWTFSATTTMANVTVTTTNAATSTVQVGCIQLTATSTATPIKLVFSTIATSSPTYDGINTNALVGWRYGKCPRI